MLLDSQIMVEATVDSPSAGHSPVLKAKNVHLTPKYQVKPILRPT